MKKLLSISLVAVAAISALGYRNQVTPSAPSSLTMANIEALSKIEAWAGVEFAKNCITCKGETCVLTPFHFFDDAEPYE